MDRIVTANEQYAYEVGFDFGAAGSSETQAEMLSGFAAGLSKVCGSLGGIQLAYVEKELSPTGRKIIKELARMIEEEQ